MREHRGPHGLEGEETDAFEETPMGCERQGCPLRGMVRSAHRRSRRCGRTWEFVERERRKLVEHVVVRRARERNDTDAWLEQPIGSVRRRRMVVLFQRSCVCALVKGQPKTRGTCCSTMGDKARMREQPGRMCGCPRSIRSRNRDMHVKALRCLISCDPEDGTPSCNCTWSMARWKTSH